MAKSMYKTQIVLEPEQHKALAEIADREGRTIADLVQDLIKQVLEQHEHRARSQQSYSEGMSRIREHKEAILAERGGRPIELDTVELIHQMREERDERNLSGLLNPGD
ncbi:MAG TPA: hypothetical protein VEW94_03495 [Chloroflexia bacterium]|nr:hypothetical protein [Chloroflexia bacterium]